MSLPTIQSTGGLTYNGDISGCPATAATSCGASARKRSDKKSKLEEMMSRRPAKTIKSTEEMEKRRKVMKGKRAIKA